MTYIAGWRGPLERGKYTKMLSSSVCVPCSDSPWLVYPPRGYCVFVPQICHDDIPAIPHEPGVTCTYETNITYLFEFEQQAPSVMNRFSKGRGLLGLVLLRAKTQDYRCHARNDHPCHIVWACTEYIGTKKEDAQHGIVAAPPKQRNRNYFGKKKITRPCRVIRFGLIGTLCTGQKKKNKRTAELLSQPRTPPAPRVTTSPPVLSG